MAYKIINTPFLLSGGKYTGKKSTETAAINDTKSDAQRREANKKVSTSTNVIGTKAEKEKGVIGTRGPDSSTCPNALTLTQINNLTDSSGASNELRKRAVKIAYSYIGADELPGKNLGWYDSIFEEKMKNMPKAWLSGEAWCNSFTNLVWIEAFSTGNALVSASNNSTWIKTLKDVFNNGGWRGKTPKDKYLNLSKGTASTYGSFAKQYKGKYFISQAEAKSGKKLPQPGDMVRYNDSHIEIVSKVTAKNGKMVSYNSISGNSSANDPRDGGGLVQRTNVSIDTGIVGGVTGFLVLSETYS